MKSRILLVDDDPNILQGYRRHLRSSFKVDLADGGEQGLESIAEHGPYSVVVSDMRMPGMDGVQFLNRVHTVAPNTVRMMLTGNADLDTAIQAVNEGNIFRFLTKPCSPEMLIKALEAGVEQYRLIMSEREILEKTLSGCVKILTEVLSLVSPSAFGRATRVRHVVAEIARQLGIENAWQLEIAAMLSQVGCLTVPNEVLEAIYRDKTPTPANIRTFLEHPSIGARLIERIPRMECVSEIVAYQEKNFNGSGAPEDDLKGEAIPIGARVLHVALDYDTLVNAGREPKQAISLMSFRTGKYDPSVIAALSEIVGREMPKLEIRVRASELQAGMTFADNVRSRNNMLLVARGQEVTPSLIMHLKNFAERGDIPDSFKVFVPAPETSLSAEHSPQLNIKEQSDVANGVVGR